MGFPASRYVGIRGRVQKGERLAPGREGGGALYAKTPGRVVGSGNKPKLRTYVPPRFQGGSGRWAYRPTSGSKGGGDTL